MVKKNWLSLLAGRPSLRRRLFGSGLDDRQAIVARHVGRRIVIFRNFVIFPLEGDVRSETSITDFHFRFFFETLDEILDVFLAFGLDEADGFVERDVDWVQLFRNGNEFPVMPEERTETPYRRGDDFPFKFAYRTG